ncbi:hypothetical protein C8Q76DRAFT_49711 [Earliella scabrosa]|nr:hypothetical protein C8Q76DRAFT_49711 [Earliella scabrosa]
MSLPPPPADALQVITISSLAAALAKLHVDISIEDIIEAVQDENEAQRAKLTTEATNRRAALSQLALELNEPSAGLKMTTVSKFISKPNKPTNVDPLAKERRRRLIELTQEAFPDGKVPDPFTAQSVAGRRCQ